MLWGCAWFGFPQASSPIVTLSRGHIQAGDWSGALIWNHTLMVSYECNWRFADTRVGPVGTWWSNIKKPIKCPIQFGCRIPFHLSFLIFSWFTQHWQLQLYSTFMPWEGYRKFALPVDGFGVWLIAFHIISLFGISDYIWNFDACAGEVLGRPLCSIVHCGVNQIQFQNSASFSLISGCIADSCIDVVHYCALSKAFFGMVGRGWNGLLKWFLCSLYQLQGSVPV